MKKSTLYVTLTAVVGLALMQAVPYGRDHNNPSVVAEPQWDSPDTRELARRACFNCHSFETIWPWYARYAPVSWLIAHDVQEGREKLNFSDWQGGTREGERPEEIAKEITEGDMPPFAYRFAHPEARLSAKQRTQLIEGLSATLKGH
ncbi:MAG: hypothetical protein GJT30_00055 [Geobacter sp.]|nr:hypothetical protein [Geobacter sp.]